MIGLKATRHACVYTVLIAFAVACVPDETEDGDVSSDAAVDVFGGAISLGAESSDSEDTTVEEGQADVPVSGGRASSDGPTIMSCPMITDEECNGVDDDCDGKTDETFRLGAPCRTGIGACTSEGLTVCDSDGGVVCDAAEMPPVEELCNSVDDDCDGQTDETFFDLGLPCFQQENDCRREGTLRCSDDGLSVLCDVPGPILDQELCDGKDNDCDTKIDEGLDVGSICSLGEGLCRRGGFVVCGEDGRAVCDAEPGMPSVETCDGADNDCDGLIDEDFGGGVCTVGVGGCARDGVRKCDRDGNLVCDAVEGEPKPELCNGFDDDCDDIVDEAYPHVGEPCSEGLGTCRAEGIVRCSLEFDSGYTFSGIEQNLSVDALAAGGFELCWNSTYDQSGTQLDDIKANCRLDKVLMGCRRTGSQILTVAAMGNHDDVFFDVGDGQNAIHQHNGVAWYFDDDSSWGFAPLPQAVNARAVQRRPCDQENGNAAQRLCWETTMGTTGRGYRCGSARGASNQWERVLFHRPVGPRSECSAVAGQADFVDVCNGVDEDCDGSIDEGSPGTGEACEGPNLNVCEVAITACDEAGQLVCQAVAVEPRREGCNGADDDCDGRIDEDFDTLGDRCETGVGVCRSQGTVACSGGAQAAGLAFEGIRNDVPVAELESLAFEPCFSTPYNTTIEGVDRVTQACNLGEWVVACRQNGAATYTVAATGLKTEILTDLGNRPNAVHNHNGVDWYFSQSHSMGFAEPGTGVRRTSCDTQNVQPEKRLCWHTNANRFTGGYRCGATVSLNNNAQWERIILHREPGGRAECNAVPGPPQPVVPCDDVDDDCDGDADERRAPVQCDGIDDDCDGDAEEGRAPIQCDGVDDDCDGDLEEARPVVHCDNVDDDCDGDVDEAREVVACDDVDDDCDGSIDEGGVGEACDLAELEVCEEGRLQCNDGGQIICQAVQYEASRETCNGRDDDCDGRIDEDYNDIGRACSVGVGVCRNEGLIECSPESQLAFEGVRTAIPVDELTELGFESCFSTAYNSVIQGLDAIFERCRFDEWVLACRPNGAANYTVAATGLKTEILTDLGNEPQGVHTHNGVDWYYSDSYSMGFAAQGTGVRRTSCDTLDVESEKRLCWHTRNNGFSGGYRCGDTKALNGNADWERVILHRASGGRAVCSASPGRPQPVEACDGVDDDCDGDAEEAPGNGQRCD